MPLQVQITNIQPIGNQLRVAFKVIPSGSYTTAIGGDTLDFTKATVDPSYVGMAPAIPASQGPICLDVWDAGGNIANGVQAVMGTTQANSKVKFTSAFNTELGTGAYPAPILATQLQGEAIFNKLL